MPTILQQDGRPRSSKAIAPTQTEGDEVAYGTRKSKCLGAERQKKAWDENTRLQIPLFCALNEPLPFHERHSGEWQAMPGVVGNGEAQTILKKSTISDLTMRARDCAE